MLIPCILYRKSTDQIIDYDTQLNSDNLPVQGLDPDLEYYAKYTPNPEPEYDPRGWRLITTSVREEIQHPDYPLNRYTTTFATERRTDLELNQSVDNMESWANGELSPIDLPAKVTRVEKVLHKKIKGIIVEPWEDELANFVDEIADKMDLNADNKDQMYDFIEANPTLVPDFDAGWVTS